MSTRPPLPHRLAVGIGVCVALFFLTSSCASDAVPSKGGRHFTGERAGALEPGTASTAAVAAMAPRTAPFPETGFAAARPAAEETTVEPVPGLDSSPPPSTSAPPIEPAVLEAPAEDPAATPTPSQDVEGPLSSADSDSSVPLVEEPGPETAQPETAQPEEPGPETAQPEEPGPETAQPEEPGPETAQPEEPGPETAQPEEPGPETAQPEEPGPETAQPEEPGPETAQPEEPGPETAQPEEPGPETAQPEEPGPETAQPEEPGPETAQPEEPGPETAQPEEPGPETAQPEEPGPETAQPEEPGPETAQPEEPGPETAQPEEPGPETAQPEEPGPETAQPEEPGPETAQPEEPGPETAQPEEPGPETAQPEEPGPETAQPEEPGPETAQPETVPYDRVWIVDDAGYAAASAAAADRAGVLVVAATGDLRALPRSAREAISAASEVEVLSDLGEDAAWQLEVVRRGEELPGGGLLLFEPGDERPGRRLVAAYGHPSTSSLGVLGEQGPEAAVERLRSMAEGYGEDGLTVLPTLEIIATVASASAGADGDYSSNTDREVIRPWIEAAAANGVYVVLDLQPGRSTYLSQAKYYEEFLRLPHVGLALDPEWRLKPHQVHLAQIGTVDAAEINRLVDWLAGIVREEALPQKLLILHQFRFSMITNRAQVETPPELAVLIHMDGQGSLTAKYNTWNALTGRADADRFHWGWKNFYDEDSPMATPQQVLALSPKIVFVSFQ